ncbi:LamG-like jellyroll fold domain-containing protein [Sulfuriroseicoccus oceanibius]|uniref:FecR domain-containing protein n=1 Tax=Sulfuriroseicoccus oceanibius TaxID=2707525 RepID=A0A7T7JD16_9BACT|nr:LamG-like jellyroll fold domain-containing protein [Sulfuriroseicoccus oceanibius]QQL45865.1 FecR domain-containing protein [Sulfuriroseicoccus oceanibius]
MDRLLQQMLEGVIAPQDLMRVRQALLESEEARQHYLDLVELHNMLDQGCGQPVAQNFALAKRSPAAARGRSGWMRGVVAAAAVVVLSFVWIFVFGGGDGRESADEQGIVLRQAPGTEIRIIGESGRRSDVMRVGSRLEVNAGSVELQFPNGVSGVLAAPAVLDVKSLGRVDLLKGSGRFRVEEAGEGFVVRTDSLEAVDLGTEFGVAAPFDRFHEVHVFEGEVVARAVGEDDDQLLRAGDGCRLTKDGGFEPIPARAAAFLKQLPASLPYLHWSFDRVEDGGFAAGGTAANVDLAHAVPREKEASGLMVDGVRGRAVEIKGFNEELVTEHPGIGERQARTIACWLRIDRLPESRLARQTIVGWGDRGRGFRNLERWQVALTRGEGDAAELCIIGAGEHRGTTALEVGRWYHVAVVWDRTARVLRAYIDGEHEPLLHEGEDEAPFTYTGSDASPLVIGATMDPDNVWFAPLRGAMDELFVIEGALDQQAIQRLKETNLVDPE